eukprot:SAG11_NODE_7076_length_1198_cov_1.494995_1_plen_207_part_00
MRQYRGSISQPVKHRGITYGRPPNTHTCSRTSICRRVSSRSCFLCRATAVLGARSREIGRGLQQGGEAEAVPEMAAAPTASPGTSVNLGERSRDIGSGFRYRGEAEAVPEMAAVPSGGALVVHLGDERRELFDVVAADRRGLRGGAGVGGGGGAGGGGGRGRASTSDPTASRLSRLTATATATHTLDSRSRPALDCHDSLTHSTDG